MRAAAAGAAADPAASSSADSHLALSQTFGPPLSQQQALIQQGSSWLRRAFSRNRSDLEQLFLGIGAHAPSPGASSSPDDYSRDVQMALVTLWAVRKWPSIKREPRWAELVSLTYHINGRP